MADTLVTYLKMAVNQNVADFRGRRTLPCYTVHAVLAQPREQTESGSW
jgi:hypothetical protein